MKTLIWQNCTEGPMTEELKRADMVLLSEASPWRVRLGRPTSKTMRTRRLKGLVISAKRSEFKVVQWGWRRFHRSGKAEGWPGIRTPPRGVLWTIGYWRDDPDKKLYMYWVTHFLNSWNPAGRGDRWTKKRYEIVTELEIPVVEDLVSDKTTSMLRGRRYRKFGDQAYVEGGLGGGDTNSLPWDGRLEGMEHVHNRGLDRVWKFGRVKAEYVGQTPKTGVGKQMRHHGEKVKQNINRKGKK